MEGDTRGDPESLLRWTAKSARHLADALRDLGHQAHFATVAKLLRGLGYSLQANRTAKEGALHPDRDAQFEYINATAAAALEAGQPVISVDTKKKELVGDFKNGGREWRPKGSPELVRTHDFNDKELGKAIPYSITASNVSGATWPSRVPAAPPASTSPKPSSRSRATPPAGTARTA